MQSKEAMTLYIKKIKDLEASFKKTEDDEDIWMDENDNENINNEKVYKS